MIFLLFFLTGTNSIEIVKDEIDVGCCKYIVYWVKNIIIQKFQDLAYHKNYKKFIINYFIFCSKHFPYLSMHSCNLVINMLSQNWKGFWKKKSLIED